jgi:hypothetical protein
MKKILHNVFLILYLEKFIEVKYSEPEWRNILVDAT